MSSGEQERSVFSGDDIGYPIPKDIFVIKDDDSISTSSQPIIWKKRKPTHRSLLIVRHGERVDYVFGSWIPHCFDDDGNYTRLDLNMPKSLPKRSNGQATYLDDSPITNIGIQQASMVGEAICEHTINIMYAYSSPAFRCVQTCDAILSQIDNNIKIRIEPGLFEMMSFHKGRKIEWMLPGELAEAGFNVDLEYVPICNGEDVLKMDREDCEEFYRRNAAVTETILKTNPTGSVLLVGHSSSLESCSHKLLGSKPKNFDSLLTSITKIPYCAVMHLDYVENKWEAVESVLPLTHGKNPRYDWKKFFG